MSSPEKPAIPGQAGITGSASGPVATTTCAVLAVPPPTLSCHPGSARSIRLTAVPNRIHIPTAYCSR